jgi:hypothetical protein
MTSPSPLALPVITPTLLSRENEGNVRLECGPPLPCTAPLGGSSPTFGYSTGQSSLCGQVSLLVSPAHWLMLHHEAPHASFETRW